MSAWVTYERLLEEKEEEIEDLKRENERLVRILSALSEDDGGE